MTTLSKWLLTWAAMMALGIAAIGYMDYAYGAELPTKPDPKLTPGVVLTTDKGKLCVPGYSATVRHTSHPLKEQVFAEYGITGDMRKAHKWEIDHLVSLELGGADVLQNLWPQPYEDAVVGMGAHHKDTLENKLHALACRGQITFDQAQKDLMTRDWHDIYNQYVQAKTFTVRVPAK